MKPTRYSEDILKRLLASAGISETNIDLKLCFEAFKNFSHEQFDCLEDALLWETGTYDITGENLLSCTFVRQFTIDENGENDHMEHLEAIIYFKPNEVLDLFTRVIWSYDCDDNFEEFFKTIECDDSYLIPSKRYKPVRFEISFHED
ncbi:MAG: hypothetical protein WA125_02055 [Desulfosporosinus sp.]